MYLSKSIDEIYSEVKGYDVALCNDAPLALALNNRIDVAKLGRFAVTPRQIVSEMAIKLTGKPIIDDITLVKKVSDETGYSIKYVHAEIENIKRMMRFTSTPEKYLGRRSRNVLASYRQYNTLENIMQNYDFTQNRFFEGKSVVVVGLNLFDNLDKNILPKNFDEVDITSWDEYRMDEVRIIGNNRQIAKCAVDIVKRTKPTDVAIVFDTGDTMADAVRSALYRSKVPFINSLTVRDLNSVRDFLEFLTFSLTFDTISVSKVRELISAYGGKLFSKYDKYNLSAYQKTGDIKDERTLELLGLMENIVDFTFHEVCMKAVPAKERGSIVLLLSQMECSDEYVSSDIVDDLIYAVNNIGNLTHNEQIPQEEKEGVLLVDCKRSVFIDRPIVVYAGMGTEWNRDLKEFDFLSLGEKMDEDERNDHRFSSLMQQGSVRFYLANSSKNGKKAQPCIHFIRSVEDSDGIYGFEDLADKVINGPWEVVLEDRGFTADSAVIEQSIEIPRPFSQSSYNDFIKCPRMYMINRLVSSPDNTHTLTGNMIHSYAEFRASYPDLAKENGPDYYAKMIAERCAALTSVSLTDVERSKITAAVRAVDTFMERRGIKPSEYKLRAGSKQEVNMFLEHHGLNEVGDCTEVQVTSAQSHMTGVLDLIWNDIIYDFKTGSIKKSSDLEKSTTFSDKGEGKDYQALFYLTLMDNKFRGRVDEMQFIFTLNDYYMNIIKGGTGNIGITSVVLVDDLGDGIIRFHDDIYSPKTYSEKGVDAKEVIDICRSYGEPDDWIENPSIIAELRQRYKLSKKDAEGALKKITKLYSKGRFSNGKYLVITYRELEEFKERIASDYERLKEYQRFGFPAEPTISCDKCYCRSICTAEPHIGGEENVSE